MTPQERLLLLQKLASPKRLPTAQAQQAINMLKGLYRNPVNSWEGELFINNPEAGIVARAIETDEGKTDVSFKTKDTYYNRPKQPRPLVQQYGMQAVMGQLLDNIPSTREIAAGDVRKGILPDVPSQITLQAIFDAKDAKRQEQKGIPVNQRASLYTKQTKGAIKPYPPTDFSWGLDWPGFTEKIGPTTWQPKDSKGRYMKYVEWDPTSSLNNLKRLSKATNLVPGVGRFWQVLDGVMTVDSIIEGMTSTEDKPGISPTKEIIKGTVKTLADMYRTDPTINIGPILPF